MKNILLTLILVVVTTTSMTANEQDTLWYRFLGRDIYDVDFAPDDQFVIAWTQNLEFWDIETGTLDFHIPYIGLGDFNYNNELIVFSQDSTPKLIDWQTREITEGFVKEEYDFGRIKTAKSKNEFMADLINDDNTIYFWNVNTKQRISEMKFLDTIERDGYKWKRTIHEYDYLGNSDEYIYVVFDDVNSEIDNIPPSEHLRNYFIHIYNVDSKELIDSIFSFQNTSEKFGGFNKIAVLNDRNKIAINNEGGVINFYDVVTKTFYDKLIFDNGAKVNADEIVMSNDSKYIAVSKGRKCCYFIKIFNFDTKELIHQYSGGGWTEFDLSSSMKYLISHLGQVLTLYDNKWLISSVSGLENSSFTLSPNPAIGNLNIAFILSRPNNIKITLFDVLGNQIDVIDEGFSEEIHYSLDYDISDLVSGTYFIEIREGNTKISKKFIKE